MGTFKAIVSYHFKEGQEKAGYQLLEKEITKQTNTPGCSGFELLQNEKDPTRVMGIGTWNSLEDARQFQTKWQQIEKELNKLSEERPHHEFFSVRNNVPMKRVA
jgi:heme-degrading monooxygenase HmoA